jgi:anti-sigma B factor antagonist
VASSSREFDVEARPGYSVVRLTGDINGFADASIKTAWDAASSGTKSVLLDFSDVSYINSTGIALIVELLVDARARGIQISASGLSDHYIHIFEISRLVDYIQLFNDEGTAEQQLSTADRS